MWACCAVLVCPVLVGNAAFSYPLPLKIPPGSSWDKLLTCCIIVPRAREYPTNRLIVSTLAEGA